jgi:uncharacterized protein (DUF2147 family)
MIKYSICAAFLLMGMTLQAQSIFGKWRTVDDETGEEKSIVEIYERNGKVFGKIIEIFDASKRDLPCKFCEGDDYNKPIMGLNIIKNMKKEGSTYKEGTIIDPQDGKTYRCRLQLDGKDTLQVRGYLAVFYSTQYWKRVKE